MKKKWISVKCGLSRDPKHRRAMANSIWLFMHMLDVADWETGVIYDWKDEAAAEQLDMQIRTLRDQRRDLENDGYITCAQKQYGQEITIHNWTNPREYTGETYNKKQGDKKVSPQEGAQGDTQGDTQGSSQNVTPTLYSNTKESLTKAGLDWQIAVGASDEDVEKRAKQDLAEFTILSAYEKAMGYNPLGWHSDKSLDSLRRFLLTKHLDEIKTFAKWSRREFSSLTPTKARQYPKLVVECWPQAFEKKQDSELKML